MPFFFIGSAIALFLVLAFQVALKKEKAFALGWKGPSSFSVESNTHN